LDLPPQNAKFHRAQEEEESSLEEGQRQARRQQQQLLRNFSTPSKKSTPPPTLSEVYYKTKFHLQNQSILSQRSNNKLVTSRLTTILILKMNFLLKVKSNSHLDSQDINNNASVS
jgi:hypothetical protein